MQETSNNCFGSKIRSTTLYQAKAGKHECRNVMATYKTKVARFKFITVSAPDLFSGTDSKENKMM